MKLVNFNYRAMEEIWHDRCHTSDEFSAIQVIFCSADVLPPAQSVKLVLHVDQTTSAWSDVVLAAKRDSLPAQTFVKQFHEYSSLKLGRSRSEIQPSRILSFL